MFEAFYASYWQHPILLWVVAVLGLLATLARTGVHRSVRIAAVVLVVLSFLDAWLTTSDVPGLGRLGPPFATVVPLFFVLAGDFRYLLLRETVGRDGRIRVTGRGTLRALLWTFVVPVLSQVVLALVGNDRPRVLFLVYEIGFFLLVLGRMRWSPVGPTRSKSWVRALDGVALAWYGTWITADIVILGLDADIGFLLRVVPNALYYGALPAVLVWGAPRDRVGPG
ncbi:MAG: hypothetical protein KC416_08335 [Myxococcales bacterium]|nr:hypothetical protein [Myxococcales bacterium]